ASSVVDSSLSDRRRTALWEVRRPEADWLESLVDAALRVMGRPSRGILEQPNSADTTVRAKIEPVGRAFRDANHIAGFHFDGEYRTRVRMNMKQAAALHDQTHLVFIVPMLRIESREHRFEPRRLGIDVDDVGRDIATALFQLVDLPGKRGEQLVRGDLIRR